ncbi:unnamed protein product [Clonostachys byssicola]|uniref:C2H2-type domain-containing protein n=1 Tax=Clonostachys byssicola TaxID=160290 RepID=A0A9N9UIR6_9HYPO|nr:unnamed protein product [Clonostachys byssicola]
MEEVSLGVLPIAAEFDIETDSEDETVSEHRSIDKNSIIHPTPFANPPASPGGSNDYSSWVKLQVESFPGRLYNGPTGSTYLELNMSGTVPDDQEQKFEQDADSPGLPTFFQDETAMREYQQDADSPGLPTFFQDETAMREYQQDTNEPPLPVLFHDEMAMGEYQRSFSEAEERIYRAGSTCATQDTDSRSGEYRCSMCQQFFTLQEDHDRHFESEHISSQAVYTCSEAQQQLKKVEEDEEKNKDEKDQTDNI